MESKARRKKKLKRKCYFISFENVFYLGFFFHSIPLLSYNVSWLLLSDCQHDKNLMLLNIFSGFIVADGDVATDGKGVDEYYILLLTIYEMNVTIVNEYDDDESNLHTVVIYIFSYSHNPKKG